MNDQTNKDKGFLRDKLGDYQVQPPEKVWESISDGLGGGRSRKNMLILVFAAAASLALAITLGLQFFGPEIPSESGLAEQELSPLEEKVLENLNEVEAELAGAEQTANPAVQPETREQESPKIALMEEISPREDMAAAEEIVQAPQIPSEDLQVFSEDSQIISEDPQITSEEIVMEQEISEVEEAEEISDPDPAAQLTLEELDPLLQDPLPDFTETRKKDVRWMVGAALSPLYSFRDAESSVMAGAGVHESGLLSYSSGVHVNYRRNSRLAFETGIYFNKTGLAIGASGIRAMNISSMGRLPIRFTHQAIKR